MKRAVTLLVLLLLATAVLAAVDTRNKRASAINVGAAVVDVYPNPDGTIDASDRALIVGEYSGLDYSASGPPAPVSGTNPFRNLFRFPGVWR